MTNTSNFKKPVAKLIGADGNIFNLMGIASNALKQAGYEEKSLEMCNRIMQSNSYDEALMLLDEYVDIICADEYIERYTEDDFYDMDLE